MRKFNIISLMVVFLAACPAAEKGDPGLVSATGQAGAVGAVGPAGTRGAEGPAGTQGPPGPVVNSNPAEFIQNQSAAEQAASFRISGSAIGLGGFFFGGGSGDVKIPLDGVVGVDDQVVTRLYLIGSAADGGGLLTPEQMRNADVDGDGRITSLDTDAMRAISLGGSPAAVRQEARRTADIIADSAINGGSGDWNENGPSIGDFVRIGAYLAGTVDLTPRERARLDVTGDGRVDTLDSNVVFERIAGNNVTTAAARRANDSAYAATLSGYLKLGKLAATPPLPSDCNTAASGALAVDTNALMLYVCINGVWRSAQLQ